MEKRATDYVCAAKLGHKEFGYVLMEEKQEQAVNVEVIVIDHDKEWVRTIGESDCLHKAGEILSTALSQGFALQGVIHQPTI